MLNVYAVASHPLGQAALQLAQEEGPKTKGIRAVIGVLLMFAMLSGGVWLLLQSSFGPKLAYLISGTAFWGCWLVLAILWLTGVPGISWLGIPESTPKYYGPQGKEALWVPLTEGSAVARKHPLPQGRLVEIPEETKNAGILAEKAAAETAAAERISELYATDLGVPASDIAIPSVIVIDRTEAVRSGARLQWARVHFKAATPNATDTETVKALIARIEPKSVDLYFEKGNLSTPTWQFLGLFGFLFAIHAVGLAWYEARQRPAPVGAPERATVAV